MIEKNYCQHIGIITGYDSGVTAKQRLAGYQEAFSSHDMPFEEKGELQEFTGKYDLKLISLIAPTSQERIQMIAKEAEGFIYVVSSLGVTGVRDTITTDVGQIIDMIRQVTDVPTAVGFGINKPEQVHQYTQIADGAIVGSAIVRIVAQYGEQAGPKIYEYVSEMVGGLAE